VYSAFGNMITILGPRYKAPAHGAEVPKV
jgi:hypothetical protein